MRAAFAQARQFDRGRHGTKPSFLGELAQHAIECRIVEFAGSAAIRADRKRRLTMAAALRVGAKREGAQTFDLVDRTVVDW